MAAYCRVDDLRSPAGWLPVHRDQLWAQRLVSSMGSLYLYLTAYCVAGQVLFRYAVAILKYMETALMSTSSCGDLNNIMRYIGDSLHDADHLAQVTFCHLHRQSHLFVCWLVFVSALFLKWLWKGYPWNHTDVLVQVQYEICRALLYALYRSHR